MVLNMCDATVGYTIFDYSGILHERWWDDNMYYGHGHNMSGPYWVTYLKNGLKCNEYWMIHKKYHREDGPAIFGINERYFLHGKEYTKKRYLERISRQDNQT